MSTYAPDPIFLIATDSSLPSLNPDISPSKIQTASEVLYHCWSSLLHTMVTAFTSTTYVFVNHLYGVFTNRFVFSIGVCSFSNGSVGLVPVDGVASVLDSLKNIRRILQIFEFQFNIVALTLHKKLLAKLMSSSTPVAKYYEEMAWQMLPVKL